MTAVNLNRVIRGPVTAVPVVAGKGVRLVADTENNRWVVEADETVLYEGVPGTAYGGSIVISEPITNFRSYKIYLRNTERQQQSVIERFVDTSNNGNCNNWVTLESFQAGINNGDFFTVNSGCATWSSDWKTLSYSGGWAAWANNSGGWTRLSIDASNLPYIQKIIGINRIASN